ncbi:MAG TPA: AraC family transcriptional regulator [Gemmatimonadales bacterium]
MAALDTIVFETGSVRVGAFRCPAHDNRFRNTGPTQGHIVVFPRTAVWIRHAGSRPFVADPGIVTIYNKGQEYTRAPLAADGDRSDWFGVSPEVAFALAHETDPRTAQNPDRPYRVEWSVSDASLYLRQRTLFRRLESHEMAPLEAEQAVLELVAEVIRRAHGPSAPRPAGRRARDAHRELAQRARAALAGNPAAPTDVTTLARTLQVSPFHLCRVFRAVTGMTLHAYRLDLRLRLALERLADRVTDLSRLAFDLGFSSHSHFTHTFRTRLGFPPSAFRPSRLETTASF